MPNRALNLYGRNKLLHCLSIQNAEKLSQVLIAIGIVVLIHWFSGPYAAVATRALYEMLFNQYVWYDPRYYIFHVPAREHITYQAFLYGPYVISTLMAPLIYKVIRQTSSLSKKICTYLFNKKNKSLYTPIVEEISTEELNQLLIQFKSNEPINLPEFDSLQEELLPCPEDKKLHAPYYHVHLNTTKAETTPDDIAYEQALKMEPSPQQEKWLPSI